MRRLIGRVVYALFAAIGLTAVLTIGGIALVLWRLAPAAPSLPDTIVLTADLGRGLSDTGGEDTLSRLVLGSRRTLRDVLDALERAAGDPRVKGVYLRLGDDTLGLGKVQELRDALAALRAKGKFALAFAETFGEFGPGTRPYYLAAACDEIWLQPQGAVGLTGLYSETPFLRGTLDRLGIAARIEHRSEYKSAANSLTETEMTAPQREETEALLGSLAGQIVLGIGEGRGIAEAEVKALIDRGPFLAEEARTARLVDRLGYRDEALARAHERAGAGAETVTLSRYLDTAGRPHRDGPAIALIYATGAILRGAAAVPLTGGEEANAGEIARAFRAAVHDSEVRAIVLRIDSPGGSAIGSETIWREIVRARGAGKPVVVSMGDVAASGGYYIAAPADRIVAQPATVTGSIGVLAGKVVVAGLLQKLGVTSDAVQRGANAGMFSPMREFSPSERARLDAYLDATYRGFKAHVAAGRHLSADAVEAVAKGRVWSGEDAKARGLVDELGGYAAALRLAREAAGIAADGKFKVQVFPRDQGLAELFYERLTGDGRDDEAAHPSTLERGVLALHWLLGAIDAAAGDPGILRTPPIGEVR